MKSNCDLQPLIRFLQLLASSQKYFQIIYNIILITVFFKKIKFVGVDTRGFHQTVFIF